jgi:hypothetical protein
MPGKRRGKNSMKNLKLLNQYHANCSCDKCVGEMWNFCSYCEGDFQNKDLEVEDVKDNGQAVVTCKSCKEEYAREAKERRAAKVSFNYDEIFGDIFGGA